MIQKLDRITRIDYNGIWNRVFSYIFSKHMFKLHFYFDICNIVCNTPIFSFKNIYTILKQMASLVFCKAHSLESREILIAAIIQPVM